MSEFNGKKVGSFGDFGCFSLQNSKVITCGEGGAVVGNDDQMMDRAPRVYWTDEKRTCNVSLQVLLWQSLKECGKEDSNLHGL